jgi:predicted site-specific integrase-resolvase
MNEDVLGEDSLCALAGAHTRPTLIRWLRQNRIPFVLARSGWPRVHRRALERAMGVDAEVRSSGEAVTFNFDALT